MALEVSRSIVGEPGIGVAEVSFADIAEAVDRPLREIRAELYSAGLSGPQISALIACSQWRGFLDTCCLNGNGTSVGERGARDSEPDSASSVDPMQVRSYLQVMGFLSDNRIVTAALRSNNRSAEVAERLRSLITTDNDAPFRIAEGSPTQLQSLCPELTRSQAALLQGFVRHRLNLDELNVERLSQTFPFPITAHNYFGRFLAGGCESPDKAIRHLTISTPFFIRLRPLLEGLSNERMSYLTVGKYVQDEKGQIQLVPVDEDHRKIVHAYVNRAEDLVAGQEMGIDRGLTCIEMPRLPEILTHHIGEKEHWKLAGELYDWLFLGKMDGELLSRKALSVKSERRYEQVKRRLTRRIGRQAALFKNTPPEGARPSEVRKWESRYVQLENDIREDRDEIAGMDEERRKMKPLVKVLQSDDSLLGDIREFRKKVVEARAAGRQIVFSFLGKSGRGGSEFLFHLDRAITTKRPVTSEGVRILRTSKYLLSPEVHGLIEQGRVGGKTSVVEKQMREFEMPDEAFNHSLGYVTSGILPEREDPQLRELIDILLANVAIPGVSTPSQMKYLVANACGKKTPKAEDILEYAFERSEEVEILHLSAILRTLRRLGVERLPPRCVQLMAERFRHPATLAGQYSAFNATYQPDTLGELPAPFVDLATFDRYYALDLDAYGMLDEAQQIDRHLCESGVVVVVDSTHYHPELGEVIGEEKVQAGEEKTGESWGRYVRPSERLIRNFALSLIEGRVSDELKHHSLVGVNKQDKREAALRAAYGVDLDLTPSLAKINRVLGDLTVYDDSAIVVLHAESVKDREQFRDFVDLLSRYKVKTIVRSREAIPGLPQVLVQPFQDREVADRLASEEPSLRRRLGIKKPIEREVFDFAADQVYGHREPSVDPLNLTMQLLSGAAQVSRMKGHEDVIVEDVVRAMPQIFHRPDAEQMRMRGEAIEEFAAKAPAEVLGQGGAIRKLADMVKSHIYETRDQKRPLSILLPGPTGVGKTELAMRLALAANVPFFDIEGSQFTEPHSLSRLVGSPPGYADANEGLLFKFLEANTNGIIFIDEIDKMHPTVYQGLMNFFDKARLTSGGGKLVTRPGMIIIGASNSAADVLNPDMTMKEVKKALAEAFVDPNGVPRPEIVARFEPIPMLAIAENDFRKVLKQSLEGVGKRTGIILAGLKIVGAEDAAVDLLFREAKEVCQYEDEGRATINAFARFSREKEKERLAREAAEKRRALASQPDTGGSAEVFTHGELTLDPSDFYNDLRHVSRAVDNLAGESIRKAVEEQHSARRKVLERGKLREMRLVVESDDPLSPSIKLVDVEPIAA